jgi:MFS family permease
MNHTRSDSPTAADGKLSVLRNRNFTLLWIGLIISNSGSWMTLVGQGWLVYQLTGSALALGIVGVARAIPMVVFPPMGGVIADRLPRLKLLKVTQIFSCLLSVGLAALVQFDLIAVWQIVAFSFLSGFVNAFDQPTRQAMTPDLVRREDLTKAIALQSSAWQGSALFGPTLAGITIATVGVAGAFYFDGLSFLAVVAALFAMKGVPERSTRRGRSAGFTSDLKAGLSYVRSTPLLLTLILMSTIAGVFGRSFQQFLPVFAKAAYHQGSFGLGLMTSAPGLGTLVGAFIITVLSDSRRKGLLFLVSMLLFGLTLIAFSFDHLFVAGLVLLFFAGMFTLIFSSTLQTMIQLESAPEMRGRVTSLITVTMQGFSPLGGLITGAIAGPLGTEKAVVICAAVCAAAALLGLGALPRVRDYAAAPPAEAPAEAAWGTEPASVAGERVVAATTRGGI